MAGKYEAELHELINLWIFNIS